MHEYIEGLRATYHTSSDGKDIFSVHGWDGRVLFQGTLTGSRHYRLGGQYPLIG